MLCATILPHRLAAILKSNNATSIDTPRVREISLVIPWMAVDSGEMGICVPRDIMKSFSSSTCLVSSVYMTQHNWTICGQLSVRLVGVFLGGRPVVSVSNTRTRITIVCLAVNVNIKKHWDCFILEFEYQFYRGSRLASRVAGRFTRVTARSTHLAPLGHSPNLRRFGAGCALDVRWMCAGCVLGVRGARLTGESHQQQPQRAEERE